MKHLYLIGVTFMAHQHPQLWLYTTSYQLENYTRVSQYKKSCVLSPTRSVCEIVRGVEGMQFRCSCHCEKATIHMAACTK